MKAQKRNAFLALRVASVILSLLYALTTTAQNPTSQAEKQAAANQAFIEAFELQYLEVTEKSLRAAIAAYEKASKLFREAGDKENQAVSLGRAGRIASDLGDYAVALKNYNEAVSLFRAQKSVKWEAQTLNNIGSVYLDLGEKSEALKYFNLALPPTKQVGDKKTEAVLLNNIGRVYEDLEERQKALTYYEQALSLFRQIGGKPDEVRSLEQYEGKKGEATILNNIGEVYRYLGDSQKALEYLNQALPISRLVDDTEGEATTLNNLGLAYLGLGELQEALKYYNLAFSLSQQIGDEPGKAATLANLMTVWERLKNLHFAIFYGKQSVNAYQQLRVNIKDLDKELQHTFLKSVEGTYRKLAEILIAEGRFAEAQNVLALLKEEEYFQYVRRDADEIKNLKGNINLKPNEQKLIERYNLLAGKITEIGAEFQALDDKKRKLPEDTQLSADEQKRYDELSAQIADANAAFKLFLEKELVAEFGKENKEKKKEIVVDRALQEKLRQWGNGTVTLYTIAGDDRYRVILTTPTVQVDGKTEIKAADLNKKIFAFREALQNPTIDPRPLGKEIYDILIKPIEKDLQAANAKTLIWSLDGTLRYIPLGALSPDGKSYLIEKYQSVVITSATRQSLSEENEKDWRTLGLGVSTAQTVSNPVLPDEKITFSALPGVREELTTIVKDENAPNEKGLLAGKRLIDADFNAKNFGDSLTKETADGRRKYTIVHIASHFQLGNDPANSFLLLGGGNTLTLEQISNSPQMKFGDVELVTLSACNTAFGNDATGKEVDSLATFIELRGAKAIMATLWSVADESTQLLMSEFYRLHKENPNLTKTEAMQRAQIAMIEGKLNSSGKTTGCRSGVVKLDGTQQTAFKCDKDAPFSHPYFWSPFVLIGNWR